ENLPPKPGSTRVATTTSRGAAPHRRQGRSGHRAAQRCPRASGEGAGHSRAVPAGGARGGLLGQIDERMAGRKERAPGGGLGRARLRFAREVGSYVSWPERYAKLMAVGVLRIRHRRLF